MMERFNRTKGKTNRARRLRVATTPAERKLWSILRQTQLEGTSFRRQHPAGPYILDFYCPSLALAIEVDGSQHGLVSRMAADRVRDDWLRERGITMLRFWNNEVSRNLHGVTEVIRMAMLDAQGALTPSHLPLSGGGDAPPKPGRPKIRWQRSQPTADSTGEGETPPPPERGRTGGGRLNAPIATEKRKAGATAPPTPERGRMGGGRDGEDQS
jgi:very-short-patch-repair endonuclease